MVDFDSRKRTKIRYADDKYINVEGMGNVKVKVKNGKTIMIKVYHSLRKVYQLL